MPQSERYTHNTASDLSPDGYALVPTTAYERTVVETMEEALAADTTYKVRRRRLRTIGAVLSVALLASAASAPLTVPLANRTAEGISSVVTNTVADLTGIPISPGNVSNDQPPTPARTTISSIPHFDAAQSTHYGPPTLSRGLREATSER